VKTNYVIEKNEKRAPFKRNTVLFLRIKGIELRKIGSMELLIEEK